MTWTQQFDSSGNVVYMNSETGQTTSDPTQYQSQSAITPSNLTAAFQQIYGTAPTQDWINQTAKAYQCGNICGVRNNLAIEHATDNIGFQDTAGSKDSFNTGAQYYLNQGDVAGKCSYEGVPTQFYDKNGNLVASYGSVSPCNGGKAGKSYASCAWTWNNAAATPTGYSTALAEERPQCNAYQNLEMFGGAAAALAGAAAFAPALAGADAGAGVAAGAGAEAFPISDPGLIAGTELGAGGAGGAGGLSFTQALQYGKTGLGALQALSGLGANSPTAGAGGALSSGASSSSSGNQYSPNGPWNNNGSPLTPQEITWAKQSQAPVALADSNLHQIYNNIDPNQSNQSFYTYGSSPSSSAAPQGYAEGGDVHRPEFITGATGHYVKGRGTGQSDEIPAMLADGEFVFDADTVAQLGDGSSDAGAHLLNEFRKSIREHKRSAPVNKIPPKAAPLSYMKNALERTGRK